MTPTPSAEYINPQQDREPNDRLLASFHSKEHKMLGLHVVVWGVKAGTRIMLVPEHDPMDKLEKREFDVRHDWPEVEATLGFDQWLPLKGIFRFEEVEITSISDDKEVIWTETLSLIAAPLQF